MKKLKQKYDKIKADIIKSIEKKYQAKFVGFSPTEAERRAHFIFEIKDESNIPELSKDEKFVFVDYGDAFDFDFDFIKQGIIPEYDKILTEIISAFCKKTGLTFFDWIEYNSIADFSSFVFDINNIIYFIFNNINVIHLFNWYDLRYSGEIKENFVYYCKIRGFQK